MRLAEGIVIDEEKTFGELKFSALRREKFDTDAEGNRTGELKERTYDLKSKAAGQMIQVSIPGEVPLKEFELNTVVRLVNPVVDTVVSTNYRDADVSWYIKADDIVIMGADGNFAVTKPQGKQPDAKDKKAEQQK